MYSFVAGNKRLYTLTRKEWHFFPVTVSLITADFCWVVLSDHTYLLRFNGISGEFVQTVFSFLPCHPFSNNNGRVFRTNSMQVIRS